MSAKPKPDRTLDALIIIRDNPKIDPRTFAGKFWPDALMHERRSRGGHGAQKGKGAWLAAGSFVAKLEKRGLVTKWMEPTLRHYNGWVTLTKAGDDYIKARS